MFAACGADTDPGPRQSAGNEASASCADYKIPQQDWDQSADYTPHSGELTPRQQIADRIVECQTLDGSRRADVTRLLGEPDEWGSDPVIASYWLGEERGPVVVDSEYLSVEFGPRNTVSDVRIIDG
jgi:hypothetical protein